MKGSGETQSTACVISGIPNYPNLILHFFNYSCYFYCWRDRGRQQKAGKVSGPKKKQLEEHLQPIRFIGSRLVIGYKKSLREAPFQK